MKNHTDLEQCRACEGSGRVAIGEHFVTREMAIDGGDPALEGMSFGIEYGPCQECSGSGWIDTASTRAKT